MSVLRLTRFKADPKDADQVLARRAELIDAIRAKFPGLTEARLARVDDESWVDVWRWESADALDAAVAGAHSMPETPAAFAIVRDASVELLELIDER